MNPIPLLLADADTQSIMANWRLTESVREKIMIVGAIGLVTALLVLWAVFLRKRRRRRRSAHHPGHHRSSSPAEVPAAAKVGGPSAPEEQRSRHRRSRRRHRRRNPTLAETGGLPPIRPETASEPEP